MKFGPKKPNNSADEPKTYEEKVNAFCKRAGLTELPVIKAGMQEWAEWMEYFEHTGNPFGRAQSWARQRGRMDVPTLWPDDFEPGWRATPKADIGRTDLPPAKHVRQPAIAWEHDWTDAELADENVIINRVGRPYVRRPRMYLSHLKRFYPENGAPAYGFLTPKEAELAREDIAAQNKNSTKTPESKARVAEMAKNWRGPRHYQPMFDPPREDNPPPPPRDPLTDPLPVKKISAHLAAQLRGELPIGHGITGCYPVGDEEYQRALRNEKKDGSAE